MPLTIGDDIPLINDPINNCAKAVDPVDFFLIYPSTPVDNVPIIPHSVVDPGFPAQLTNIQPFNSVTVNGYTGIGGTPVGLTDGDNLSVIMFNLSAQMFLAGLAMPEWGWEQYPPVPDTPFNDAPFPQPGYPLALSYVSRCVPSEPDVDQCFGIICGSHGKNNPTLDAWVIGADGENIYEYDCSTEMFSYHLTVTVRVGMGSPVYTFDVTGDDTAHFETDGTYNYATFFFVDGEDVATLIPCWSVGPFIIVPATEDGDGNCTWRYSF